MKVIDLLNKIANGEEAPRKIKYCKHIYELIENKLDWYCYKNSNYFLRDEIGLWHLNFEVKIVDKDYIENIPEEDTPKEDIPTSKLYINNKLQYDLTPKEDKKIEKLDIGDELFSLINNGFEEHSMHKMLKLIELKLNEIIDKVNGDSDDN